MNSGSKKNTTFLIIVLRPLQHVILHLSPIRKTLYRPVNRTFASINILEEVHVAPIRGCQM